MAAALAAETHHRLLTSRLMAQPAQGKQEKKELFLPEGGWNEEARRGEGAVCAVRKFMIAFFALPCFLAPSLLQTDVWISLRFEN